ncbi:GNAT family N-acetyltransferase [Cytobacillus sp. FJAT-54145]|uniref:GNAT family N-acetyltransferase n=1 Tax=Cytobacillus spartinae TaxID=3299023 RepID=A0ABW6KCZ9_9BACI
MDIRKGEISDLEQIMRLVNQTVELMKAEGNDQWKDDYPKDEDFLLDIKLDALFVAEQNGQIIGGITVDQVEAEEYQEVSWRKEGEDAFVFHRLAVDPNIRGRGIASELIKFAERWSIEKGIYYMKTDTYSLNVKAQRLFEKNGYMKVGQIYFEGREHPFYCYDKILEK